MPIRTGLTPKIDELKTLITSGVNKGHFYDLRSGCLSDFWGALPLTSNGNARLQKGGGWCGVPGTDYFRSGATGLSGTEISYGVMFILDNYPSSTSYPFRDDDTGSSDIAIIISNTTFRPTLALITTGGTKQTAAVAGTEVAKGRVCSIAGSAKNNAADGLRCYKDGISIAHANVSTVGETLLYPDNGLMLGRTIAATGFIGTIVGAWEINKYLTSAEHLQINNEFLNQMKYETNLVVLPKYVAGMETWSAGFGLLADEKTTTVAGQCLGGCSALRATTGTHKISAEFYNGTLAKVIICVTNGNVTLPNIETHGTTYYFKKYTGGAWTNASSASPIIALVAGEKILWATASGRDNLYKI